MRKILSLLAVLVLCATFAFAQTKTVTGKVTDDTGDPVPFATVSIKGSKIATVCDVNGVFLLKAKQGDVLVITAQGLVQKEVPLAESSILAITLTKSKTALEEVVVTGAYGTKRTSRSTSYNAQVVSGSELNTIRQTDLNNALAGKVAGMQVRSQSLAKLGSSTNVRLRGAGGLGGDQDVIYVVDGTILPNGNDINMDEVESVTVLQGPAAAAQFGSQGANGAIVITLKKGHRNAKGVGVDVTTGAQFDKVYILPHYQNSYSGGSTSDMYKYTWQPGQPEEWKALDGKYYHNYEDDASWGPRMVGQEYIPWYAWYPGSEYSFKTAKLTAQPDNARQFFNTGVTLNNTVSFTKVTDNVNLRMAYGNIDVKGLLPETWLKKNTFTVLSSIDITPQLTFAANVNYFEQTTRGEFDDSYANQSTGSFNSWFHRDLDMHIMKELKDLKTEDGVYASWNHQNPTAYQSAADADYFYGGNYWYNYYTYFHFVNIKNHYDRLYGDVSLTYKITNDLKVKATYRKDQNVTYNETIYSSELEKSATQTGLKAYYGTNGTNSNRENLEFSAAYSKKIRDFQLNANVGSDFYKWTFKGNYENTNQGLNVPGVYTIGNSYSTPSVSNSRATEKYNALYAIGSLGWKDMLFADFTLRNDWFSTLRPGDNSVLSKSFGGSFVFSDLLKIPFLSFGKLRAAWGEIPQALGTTTTTFGAYRINFAYGLNSHKWNSDYLVTTPNQLIDSSLHGAVKVQREIGLDLKFLHNRFGISGTYWDGSENDIPNSVTINGASGFTSLLTNTGKITKKGIDLQVMARPVWLPDFKWELNATWGRLLKNTVEKIADNVTVTTAINTIWGTTGPYVVQVTGKEWGQLYGNGIKRINGQPVLDDNGFYENDPAVYYGSVLPKYTGGVQNTFEVLKDFTVNVNLDYQVGGKFFSLSDMWGSFSGLTAQTATVNDKGNPIRDPVADGGGVHVHGVDESGKAKDMYVDAQDYFHNLYNNRAFDPFVYDLTFVKLREVSIGYNIPLKKLGIDKWMNSAVFSLVARNAWLIYANTKDFDPSEVSYLSGEASQLPGTRGLGFNLKVSF